MKFGVVTFPGSNCDADMFYVLHDIMGFNTVKLWHKDTNLQGCDFVVLPGGFSYGDYLRSGAIARFSPIMSQIQLHAKNGGYVFGVCNGFQILCESGLLPGALLHNEQRLFICKNVYIKCQTSDSLITSNLSKNEVLNIPVAHAEGKYFNHKDEIKRLNDNNQVLFRYCDENGNVNLETNLNGSVENIAGICNENRNVFGMMPHPERAADKNLGNTDGKKLFESILKKVLV